ncbi:signal recognition particle, SRP19 subunit [Parathielavia hyrcaniae]|uniref:Signal recognition particle, SRP19 subunit n=1 Tax=Parathielavia hyrcaniae TaxID=113614 RepID=A0AAN6Q1R2_9PEZI|nr:signal recognition particle, SRP19 subunit [Parathielavia hyrcaniae]
MSHPRVEEVSDSDLDMSDPSEGDIDDFVESDIMRRVDTTKPATAHQQQPLPRQQQPQPSPGPGGVQMQTTTDETPYKSFQCLYPVYFDATRTRAEGRRVPRSLAVSNPLAIEIVQACANLRLQTVLEAGKLHPKDWANPGRVKVNLRQQPLQVGGTKVNNKHHLYLLVAQHLRANPTTEQSRALRMEVRGAPMPPQASSDPAKPWPRPAVPRGWKLGELLPYYSPAMTGGGVSENFLKDMMKEMGAGAGGGAGGGGGGMPDMASLLAAAGGGGAAGGGSGGSGGDAPDQQPLRFQANAVWVSQNQTMPDHAFLNACPKPPPTPNNAAR